MKRLAAGLRAGSWRAEPEAVLHRGSGPLSVCVPRGAGGWRVEERSCLKGGQLGPP